jgi:hypothetical protein
VSLNQAEKSLLTQVQQARKERKTTTTQGEFFWDISHIPALAFLPVALASIALAVFSLTLPERRRFFTHGG